MKNIFKIFLVGLVLIGTTNSCEESTLAIDELYDSVDTSAAFIRTLSAPSTGPHNISGGNFPTSIEATIEIQEGNGTFQPDFKEVRVYAAIFADQDQTIPIVDPSNNPFGETLLMTLPASEFELSEVNLLPSTSFAIPTQTIVDLHPGAQFTLPTYIYTRLELELNDGRIFTDVNVGPTVQSGNYFLAPFFYNIIFLNI